MLEFVILPKQQKIYLTVASLCRLIFDFFTRITFRFGIFVVQFVQFFVIRCCEAAFRGDVNNQAHMAFVSESTTDDITSFSQHDVTPTQSDLCLLGQRDFLSSDGVRREIVNRRGRFVILVSAHRCCNCNREHCKFSSKLANEYQLRLARNR